jgi:hypothetical protein
VARLALTPTAILQLHNNLSSIVSMLEKKGLVQRHQPVQPAASH